MLKLSVRTLVLLALIAGGILVRPAGAQDDDQPAAPPLVIFVEGRRPLDTAAITNTGPQGISQLANIFRDYGARVEYSSLEAPLPAETKVVVLVRPLRRMDLAQVVYLWQHLKRGNNLLLALDPEDHFADGIRVRPMFVRSGLAPLLTYDYGITVRETTVVEPWSTPTTLGAFDTAYSLSFAPLPNPITDPLLRYELPVWMWGARDMLVEPLGVGGTASPLLMTSAAFAETDLTIFETEEAEPTGRVAFDQAQDFSGPLAVGAQAEANNSGSRLIVLGDSEMLQNGFGFLARARTPRYLGNFVFAQRMAAWLLELPEDQWPGMPDGFTWIALDGREDDWTGRTAQEIVDETGDAPAELDIVQFAMFADDAYLYARVATQGPAPDGVTAALSAEASAGLSPVYVDASGGWAVGADGRDVDVYDARLVAGDILEIRLPRRVAPASLRFDRFCLHAGSAAEPGEPVDCVEGPIVTAEVATRSPYQGALFGYPLVTVYTATAVNMHAGPGEDAPVVAPATDGRVFAAIGQSEDRLWILSQDGRDVGWIAPYLLTPNANIDLLPVIPTGSD